VTVHFAPGSLVLSASAKRALSALERKLEPGARVTCTGYAYRDTPWAQARARVVALYLSGRVAVHVTFKHVTSLLRDVVTVVTTRQ
jgi:hypothetical protein